MFRHFYMPLYIITVLANSQEEGLPEKVFLELFYETLCPGSRELYPQFVDVAMRLYPYLDIQTYPYGNAYMVTNAEGNVTVECQYGELECYGNKLHACAIDVLKNATEYLDFNACMIKHKPNETVAEKCAKNMNIYRRRINDIEFCALTERGEELLQYYGKESEEMDYPYVPYVLVNGNEWSENEGDLFSYVCDFFTNPPEACQEDYVYNFI